MNACAGSDGASLAGGEAPRHRRGRLPVNIAFCIEGEEENGSRGFSQAVRQNLRCAPSGQAAPGRGGGRCASSPTSSAAPLATPRHCGACQSVLELQSSGQGGNLTREPQQGDSAALPCCRLRGSPGCAER
jgi:hypothetical protein